MTTSQELDKLKTEVARDQGSSEQMWLAQRDFNTRIEAAVADLSKEVKQLSFKLVRVTAVATTISGFIGALVGTLVPIFL